MNVKNLVLILFLCSCFFGLKAQNYFVKDSSNWIVGLNSKHLNFNSQLILGENSLEHSKIQQTIGVRAGYKGLVLVVAVSSFPLVEQVNKPETTLSCVLRFYPKNMYFKVDGSIVSRNHGLGTYLQNFSDSYASDIFIWNLDVHGLYLFNKDKINLQSFFAFRNKQLRSAGSWTINAFTKSTLVKANPFVLEDLGFDSTIAPQNLFFNRIGFGGGYLYSLKITDNLHWANMLGLANELIISDTFGVNKSATTYDLILNIRPQAFSSLVYNYNQYYTGLQFEYSPRVSTSLSVDHYQLEFYSLRLSTGYRW